MQWFQILDKAGRLAQRLGWRPLLVVALLLVGSGSLAIETRRAGLNWQETGHRHPGTVAGGAGNPAPLPPRTLAGSRNGVGAAQRKTAAMTPAAAPTPSVPVPAERGLSGGRLDLNRATTRELEELPGIGRTIAGRIVAYRQSNGPFRSPEDLRRISGIGSARMARLQGLVSVAGTEEPGR